MCMRIIRHKLNNVHNLVMRSVKPCAGIEGDMNDKIDSRGVTLLELVIAVALLSIVLSSAYYFLSFATRVMNAVEAQFITEEDARISIMSLEDDIRGAQAFSYGGIRYKAVEVISGGMQLNVYTDTNNDGVYEMVRYRLENNQLKRGEASLGATPSNWTTVAYRVQNNLISPAVPIFSANLEVVMVHLILTDEKEHLKENPLSVTTSIDIRSKGAMD